ncbi:MAG: tRNA uridine-5-carboxymethylaminomethyl(34) synthesis GTPase MnmE [Candidatus Kapabacteria bacterium]|nr:tRNA uridine-5-carboxymethylaminomethyl(34) synthesis GTPase MnmE [Candidatus Kapabacteria bacterium]
MTPSTSDTICALATPPGVAGLAIIRVSGPRSFAICDAFFKGSVSAENAHDHTIHFGWWGEGEERVDSVTLMIYRTPRSYTGEDVVEIGCHGGLFVSDRIISDILVGGARLADPGEFTRRAFLNRKLDLVQVEAVADMIHAESHRGAQVAARQLAGGFTHRLTSFRTALLEIVGLLELELDFSEEDVEFVPRDSLRARLLAVDHEIRQTASSAQAASVLRSGFHIAVVGFPNAGKSSLFNALLLRDRAIVSDIPGTTRDYIRESLLMDGYTVHLADTAGLRETADTIELEGIAITRSLIEQADLVIVLNDISLGLHHSDPLVQDVQRRYPDTPIRLVHNKIDVVDTANAPFHPVLACSAKTGAGIDSLRQAILSVVRSSTTNVTDVLVNARQATLLLAISDCLASVIEGLDRHASNDELAVDLRTSVRLLGEITGETWNPDVLDTVFSRFCIGK